MRLKEKPKTLQELMGWYDNAIDELQLENEILQEENQRLQNIIDERARSQTLSSNDGIIVRGQEHDLYPNEVREVLIDVLQNARKNILDNTRRANIIDDVLAANQVEGVPSLRADALRTVMKGYSTMTAATKQRLNELGISVPMQTKNHYKTSYYNDNRYVVTLAASCSDGRGGDNAAAEMIRNFL